MYESWQHFLVIGAAGVFVGFLLWKYRPSFPGSARHAGSPGSRARRAASVEAKIKEALAKARTAATSRERAEALLTAAEAAAHAPDGLTSAMGFYLRAMRADATFCDPVRGIAALLASERPEVLETVLWRRLSHLSFSGDMAPAARCTIEELAALYRRELRHRDRAQALEKVAALL